MAETLSLDAAVAESRAHVEKVVRRNTGLFLVQAVLMIVAGIVALVYPLVTTLAVTLFLGWMLVFSGIVQAITLIANARLPHFWLQLVSAVLSVVVGVLFIRNPGRGGHHAGAAPRHLLLRRGHRQGRPRDQRAADAELGLDPRQRRSSDCCSGSG